MSDSTLERVRKMVAQVAAIPIENITSQSSPKLHKEWDSQVQVNIVMGLEQEFGRDFSPAEIDRMVSVEKIVEVLEGGAK